MHTCLLDVHAYAVWGKMQFCAFIAPGMIKLQVEEISGEQGRNLNPSLYLKSFRNILAGHALKALIKLKMCSSICTKHNTNTR